MLPGAKKFQITRKNSQNENKNGGNIGKTEKCDDLWQSYNHDDDNIGSFQSMLEMQ